MTNFRSFHYLNVGHWDIDKIDIPSQDFQEWVRLEDPNENYKNNLKK